MNTSTVYVNESEILIGIEQFIQRVLYTPQMSNQEFTQRLLELVPLFEMIYDSDLEYCESVETFKFIANELRELQNGKSPSFFELYDSCHIDGGSYSPEIGCYKDYIIENQNDIEIDLKFFQRQEKRNRKSLFEYLTKLTRHYSRLLFVRVDLGIQYEHQSTVDIELFNFYLHKLLKRVHDQSTCFKDLQGYAWAIEQGEKKGYHCHLLLIYDGHKHQNDFGLASMVGECWKEITEDQGYFFTSNTSEYKSRLEQKGVLGIGMIHRDNPQQVQNAINAAIYLVNPEKDGQHLRARLNAMRTFGKGLFEVDWRRNSTVSDIGSEIFL